MDTLKLFYDNPHQTLKYVNPLKKKELFLFGWKYFVYFISFSHAFMRSVILRNMHTLCLNYNKQYILFLRLVIQDKSLANMINNF